MAIMLRGRGAGKVYSSQSGNRRHPFTRKTAKLAGGYPSRGASVNSNNIGTTCNGRRDNGPKPVD